MMSVTPVSHTVTTERADELLKRLIASQDGVQPEEVTIAYMRQQRAQTFYPNSRYAPGLNRSEYDTPTMQFLSQEEFEAIKRDVRAKLAKLKQPV